MTIGPIPKIREEVMICNMHTEKVKFNIIYSTNPSILNGKYDGVRGWKTKIGRKLLRFPPTRFFYITISHYYDCTVF